MNSFLSLPALLLGLVAAAAVVLLTAWVRAARARARQKRRVIEAPNSHYTSKLVQESRTRHRWQDIDLGRVHEINREEVVRLLGRVDASGIEALRPNERSFLDHMAEIAGGAPAPEPREPGPALQHLRERPA